MSTPFQLVLRSLGYFTVCKTAEEYLEAEEREKEECAARLNTYAGKLPRLTGKLPRLTGKLP